MRGAMCGSTVMRCLLIIGRTLSRVCSSRCLVVTDPGDRVVIVVMMGMIGGCVDNDNGDYNDDDDDDEHDHHDDDDDVRDDTEKDICMSHLNLRPVQYLAVSLGVDTAASTQRTYTT